MQENLKNHSTEDFKQGLLEGVPVCLGYIPIAIAVGISASKLHLNFWLSQLMNMIVYSGSGELTALNLIEGGEISVITFALTLLVINCRYLLLSISMSQRLDPNMSSLQRICFGIFNVDEIFAIAIQKPGKLKAPYLFGLATLPFLGWMFGSVVGFLFTDILPKSVSDALGILLSAMIIALVIPAAKKSKQVSFVVIIAVIISVLLECNPIIMQYLTAGWVMIICAIVSATLGAIFFPVKDDGDSNE